MFAKYPQRCGTDVYSRIAQGRQTKGKYAQRSQRFWQVDLLTDLLIDSYQIKVIWEETLGTGG